ncbi:MAG TPA: class I SAM-dependent methyltransferase [Methylomirabilota bacterium]|nr:class I SAM-dependent methyltransferase [Methylomirabilota bacterium]
MSDVWALGHAYEPYVGRWSRLVARDFLDWLGVPAARAWLDVGSGTGALIQTVLETAAPRTVEGLDASAGFVAHARVRVSDPRAAFRVGDAQALPFADGAFDAAVSGLVLNFVPEPARMVAEMRRVTRSSGTVGLYVWDYSGEMQIIRRFWDAAVALDHAARALDEGPRFPICRPEALAGLFTTAGLRDVDARAVDVPTVFRDFDDYWTPFLGGQGPAPGYCVNLPEERRAALRERLRATLPADASGRIALTARAWAVKGRV